MPPGITAALTGRAIDWTVLAPAVACAAIMCIPSRWTPAKWAILMATHGAKPANAKIKTPETVWVICWVPPVLVLPSTFEEDEEPDDENEHQDQL